MSQRREVDPDDLLRRLQKIHNERSTREPRSDPDRELRHGFQEAAAVVFRFDPWTLVPLLVEPDRTTAFDLLSRDITVTRSPDNAVRWILRPDVRRRALARLSESGHVQEALEANATDSGDATGAMLARCLRGDLPELEHLDEEALTAMLRVERWLEGTSLATLPPRLVLRRMLDERRMLAPLRRLVGSHFRGRIDELEELHDYIGVLPPSSHLERVGRSLRDVIHWDEKPPLMIYGPGGVGKSTLVAKFILDHYDAGLEHTVPFIYINFDRSDLSIREPFGLLYEGSRQLSRQFPDHATGFEDLLRLIEAYQDEHRSRDFAAEQNLEFESLAPSDRVEEHLDRVLEVLGKKFKGATEVADGRPRPLLLVLDTFEEVQYASIEWLGGLWQFLQRFQRAVPKLRVVVSGRVVEESIPVQRLPLPDLDELAAQGFLEARGVADAELRQAIVDELGGNPFTLRLTAEILEREETDASAIRNDWVKRAWWKRRLEQGAIQAMLYKRILGHVHDARVRKLAHPGLVLRFITPALIERVLAGPCGLDVESADDARELYDGLARETALVSDTGDGALRTRSDLRRVMLSQIQRDQEELVREIRRNAVEYFSRLEDVRARAEEIYHRLCLGQASKQIDERWIDGLRAYLETEVEQLPPRAQAYLATRFDGLVVPDKVRQKADQEDWEKFTADKARVLLRRDLPEQVLLILHERPRSVWLNPTELLALEAEALVAQDQPEEAVTPIHEALALAERANDHGARFELLLLQGHIDMTRGDLKAARATLLEAADEANAADLPPEERLRLSVAQAEVEQRTKAGRESLSVIRELVARLTDQQLSERPSLARRAGAIVGGEDPRLLGRLVQLGGLPAFDDKERLELQTRVDGIREQSAKVQLNRSQTGLLREIERSVSYSSIGRISQSLGMFLANSEGIDAVPAFRNLVQDVTNKLVRS